MGGTQSRGRSIHTGSEYTEGINDKYFRHCDTECKKYIKSLEDHEDDMTTLYKFITTLYRIKQKYPQTFAHRFDIPLSHSLTGEIEYQKENYECQVDINNVFMDFLNKWSYYLTKSEINMINKKILCKYFCWHLKNQRPGIWTPKLPHNFETKNIAELFGRVLKRISDIKTQALTQPLEFFEKKADIHRKFLRHIEQKKRWKKNIKTMDSIQKRKSRKIPRYSKNYGKDDLDLMMSFRKPIFNAFSSCEYCY